MKEILDERRTGSMVVPAWIETSDDANLKPVLLDPMLSLLSPSLLGDRRAFKKKRKAKIVISALVKAILDGDDDEKPIKPKPPTVEQLLTEIRDEIRK